MTTEGAVYENLFSKAGLSLERLKTFIEVVEARGFTAAAKGDPTRQSQYSRQVRELEAYFGVELLVRGRGRFALTPPGEALLGLARSHLSGLDDLRRTCANEPVEVRLAAGESLLQWLVVPRLVAVRRDRPNCVWVLKNRRSEEVVADIKGGLADFGVVRSDAVPPSLGHDSLGAVEYALFVPGKIPGGSQGPKMREVLEARRMAALEGDSLFNDIVDWVASTHGMAAAVALRCSSLPQVAEAVRELGLAAVLPVLARSALGENVTMFPLRLPKGLRRSLSLVWLPGQMHVRPTLQPLIGELARAFAL